MLVATSLIFALGLAALGLAQGAAGLFAAWIVLGIAMGGGLYEAAFSALVRLYGGRARNSITGITLLAGFASTIGWPLTTLLEAGIGWRGACFTWAGLHLLLGLPLNRSLPRAQEPATHTAPPGAGLSSAKADSAGSVRASIALSLVFAITWFTSTAMAAHLPQLIMAGGATLATAVAVGALVGPAQVAGRLLEFVLLRNAHPLLSARLASLMHPLGAAMLGIMGAPAAAVFALLHGAGNGILTIANGSLPLVLFGQRGYGARQGLLMVPARIAQALAPWLFGICLLRWGANALWVSSALGVLAFGALMLVRRDRPSVGAATPSERNTSGNIEEQI